VLGKALGRHLPRGREDGQRDRQVEAGPFLPQPGRSEVHRDAPKRPLELRARDSAPHAFLRLLARLVGQADDGESRDAALQVRFHLHGPGLEADEGMGEGARKHALTLGGPDAREADASSE
jgi:hypothetical protein